MKWLKNPPTKTGLYWVRLANYTEAQVVEVGMFLGHHLKFRKIGNENWYEMNTALAWCSKRPMKPPMRK